MPPKASTPQTPETGKAQTPQPKEPKQPKDYTKKGYEVPVGEENDVHVLIEQVRFNPYTGQKLSMPVRQVVDPKLWGNVRKVWPSQGWVFVEMLHAPEGVPHGFTDPAPDESED